MSNPQSTVLICDDEAGFRGVIAELLEDDGYHVLTAGSLEQGRTLLADVSPDVAVVDLRLPDGDGIDLLRDMATLAPECLCLIVTAHASLQSAVTALRLGAHDYLEKPFQLDDLVRKVELMSRYRAVQRENAALRNLVARRDVGVQTYGRTRAMTQLLDQAARVAARGRLALITGESGSGKEVLARYIHARSEGTRMNSSHLKLSRMPSSA